MFLNLHHRSLIFEICQKLLRRKEAVVCLNDRLDASEE